MLESELTCSALSANPRNFDPALIKARRLVAKDRRGAAASAAYEMGTDSWAGQPPRRRRPAMPMHAAIPRELPVGKAVTELRLIDDDGHGDPDAPALWLEQLLAGI